MNVFVTQSEMDTDISGKLTYTCILDSIPENKLDKPITDWQKTYKTEWRWRFLELYYEFGDTTRKKTVVEISKQTGNKRLYMNRYGDWVERTVDPVFDKFVIQEYYVYTSS